MTYLPDKDCPWVQLPVSCGLVCQGHQLLHALCSSGDVVFVEVILDDVDRGHCGGRFVYGMA